MPGTCRRETPIGVPGISYNFTYTKPEDLTMQPHMVEARYTDRTLASCKFGEVPVNPDGTYATVYDLPWTSYWVGMSTLSLAHNAVHARSMRSVWWAPRARISQSLQGQLRQLARCRCLTAWHGMAVIIMARHRVLLQPRTAHGKQASLHPCLPDCMRLPASPQCAPACSTRAY